MQLGSSSRSVRIFVYGNMGQINIRYMNYLISPEYYRYDFSRKKCAGFYPMLTQKQIFTLIKPSFLISAGGVLIDEARQHVYLIFKRKTEEYLLPKGRKEHGETI